MRINKLAFTLVEIMVVIAIVIVLIVIAVPNFLRSRVTANETAAINSLRSINNGCQLYNFNYETYPQSLSDLVVPASNPPYIDSNLASGNKQGYEFVYSLVDNSHFTVNANSVFSGLLKGRYFYMDEVGVIHVNSQNQAGPNDPVYR